MRRLEIEYLSPAIAGDILEIKTWISAMRGVRAVRNYEIRRQGEENLIVIAEAVWVWIETATRKPKPIPHEFLIAFGHAPTKKATVN